MGFIRNLTGKNQARAAEKGAVIQSQAGADAILAAQEAAGRAQGFLDPFAPLGQRGIEESQLLANPQAQFDFLQNNPLFQSSLNLADRSTAAAAAAGGRLGAGDTFLDFQQNAIQSAIPLLDRQRQDIGNLLNMGSGIARSQANIETGLGATEGNLITDIGSAQSAGLVGAANANSAAAGNALNLAITAGKLIAGAV